MRIHKVNKIWSSLFIFNRNRLLIGVLFLQLFLVFANANAQSPKKALKAGKAAIEKNEYEAAIQSFTDAINLKPEYLDAFVLRGQAYEKSNKLTDAANDYRKASEISPKNEQYSYDAGRLLFALGKYMESIYVLNHSISVNKKFLPAYLLKIDCLLALDNLTEALVVCNQAIDVKKTAQNYYNHGIVSERLKNDNVAETDFRNSISADKVFKESYLGLARILLRQGKTDEAMKNCNLVLMLYPQYEDAYMARSSIYYRKSDLINAISSISKAIDINPLVDSFYFIRANYNFEYKQFENAISDYSKAVTWNSNNYLAYYKRALAYEAVKKTSEASADYAKFINLTEKNAETSELIGKAKQKIYDLNAETEKPNIILTLPVLNSNEFIEVALNTNILIIKGIIKDNSKLKYIKVNDKETVFDKTLNEVDFKEVISINDLDKITISVSDIYHNIQTIAYPIIRTEIDPPVIDVLAPYTSAYNEIFLDSEAPTVYIEGKMIDESLIKSITIDGVDAKYFIDKKNPSFSATIKIEGKESIVIKTEDIYGNITEKNYKLNRESARIMETNPMGKTWVIFIDNSNYESFASLEGPAKDISTMKAAFSKYDIHNIIEKKNMTKLQMERFFALELRDLVKNQRVNSLLVWYAGHGKYINETGYWIPVDAKRDEEFTYFNVNSLKAFMQSYTKYVTHVLVITDACESGPSFYAAMRGTKNRECGDSTNPTQYRSSQVFSSAGYELAADNSLFTKTFAKSLDYNTNSCIPIDKIVISVTESISQGSKQAPKFGKIQGLEDEDGTFFFIKKSK